MFELMRAKNQEISLQSEVILNSPPHDGIHEGQISLTHGFVPSHTISKSLPNAYKAWEDLADNLPSYISEGSERMHIANLPLLNITALPNEHLSRAIAIIGNFAHAYYFNQRLGADQKTDPLPDSVLLAWQQLTVRIQRKLPKDASEGLRAIRIHYDTFLTNWNLKNPHLHIDGVHNNEITLQDLTILSPIFGNAAEYNFNMTFVIMELRFAAALQHMTNALKAVANKDDASLQQSLQKIVSCIEDITAGLDYINPNHHSVHHVDATVWTKTVAKIDGKVPGGASGLSGSAMPLFHAIDTFIERYEYESTMGKAMVVKYNHQPEYIKNYLSALRQDLHQYSIKKYIEQSQNTILQNQYDLLMAAYLGEQGLLGVHALKVYGYMKINFRNGRLLTNGGHDGTSTIATEPQRHIYDDFAAADTERWNNFQPKQQYATKITMRLHDDKAAIIELDISNTALSFQPGDHCTIRPQNSTAVIQSALNLFGMQATTQVAMNQTWKTFFHRQGSFTGEMIPIDELLKHADLSTATTFNIEQLKPLSVRFYSVSPVLHFPNRITLTVGIHPESYAQPAGLCSNYLITDENIRFAIDRVPARHFHLPKSKNTPILMFAAGSGISPFMGFIRERSQYSDKNQNYLFFSTSNWASFYHQSELIQAVKSNAIDLSVIFSKSTTYDSIDITAKGFRPAKKYPGKHINHLINTQAKAIADLIIKQQAYVYICGNPGFSEAVRNALVSALATHGNIKNAMGYVDTMIADFRFNADVYVNPNPDQAYPKVFASEVSTHNKPDDCWGVINGNVYNLTRFTHTHPGGQKIILINGGIDMSGDYNYIKHNQRPQIEAQLQQYKIAVLIRPVLDLQLTTNLYQNSAKFLEALTEMENTLRNNTTFYPHSSDAYLWREVYSVFVNGSLASYRKPGAGNAGSLNYVLGPLFTSLCTAAEFTPKNMEAKYTALIANATNCANYIYQSSIGSLSAQQLAESNAIFDRILDLTFNLIEQLKIATIAIVKDIEINTDEYDRQQLILNITTLDQAMATYSNTLEHIVAKAPVIKTTVITQTETGSGCAFASTTTSSTCSISSAKAIAKLGLLSHKLCPHNLAGLDSSLSIK